jgi:hypothetical protein
VLAVVTSLLLASCSSHATPTPSTTVPATTTTTSATTTSTTTTTTTTTIPSTTSTTASALPCSTATLTLAQDAAKSTAGAGSSDLAYTLTNSGPTACTLDGFPDVVFFGPPTAAGAGARLSVKAQPSGAAPAKVTIDAGGAGAFYLVVGDVPVDGVGCFTVASIEVTPPGGTGALKVAGPLSSCGPSVGVTAIEALASLST